MTNYASHEHDTNCPPTYKKRLEFIDITKGIGIILVILSHVNAPLMMWASPFFIPVFFIVSGYCTYNQVNLKDKFRKLIIPYFFFSLILLICYTSFKPVDLFGVAYSRWCLYPIDNKSNYFLLRSGNGPLWFLTSMFMAFSIYWGVMKTKKKSIMLVCFFCLSYLLSYLPILLPWSIDTAFLMVIFIFTGTKIRDWAILQKINTSWFLVLLCLYAALWSDCHNVNLSVRIYDSLTNLLLAAVIGSILIMKFSTLIRIQIINNILSQIGKQSLTIFCIHIPFITLWKDLSSLTNLNITAYVDSVFCTAFIILCTYPLSLLYDKYIQKKFSQWF